MDPALNPTISAEFKALKDRVDRLERSSRMPPIEIDSWQMQETIGVTGEYICARKVVLAPAYHVVQMEGYVITASDTEGEVFVRENYSTPKVNTAICTIPPNSTGIVRFTWFHPFPVGWEAKPIELLWIARRKSGTGQVTVYRPWLLTFGGPSYLAGQEDGKPEFIGSTLPPAPPPPPPPPPPTPTTRMDYFGKNYASSWRPQGGWAKPGQIYQGTWSGWGPYIGQAYYDAAFIRAVVGARQITDCQLLVYRESGGVYGAQPLYVGYHGDYSQPGGQPVLAGVRHVGSLAVGQQAWIPIGADLGQLIQQGWANGLGCANGAYFISSGWDLQITSVG